MPGLPGSSGETDRNTAIPIREMSDKKGDKNSMKIRIINPQAAGSAEEILFEADSVSADPGGRYAVAKAGYGLYLAFRITSRSGDTVTGEYVNHFRYDLDDDIPMLRSITVDWNCIEYGFCKLDLFAPEMVNEFGGSFDKTICRFYFDWERYRTCYEKNNGVPCTKQDPNQSADFASVQRLLKR